MWLLASAAAVQAVALAVQFTAHPLAWGPAEWYRTHGYVQVPTYVFFLVAGALAAVHFDAFHRWVTTHTRVVLGAAGAALVVTYTCFRDNIAGGDSPVAAANALQPASLVWGAALVTAMYAASARWARTAPGRRVVAFAVELAFGVYLVHPLILRLLETVGIAAWLPLPPLPATFVLWAAVVALSAVFAHLIGRSPASSWLVGR